MNYLKELNKLKCNKIGIASFVTPNGDILVGRPYNGKYEVRLFCDGEKWEYMGFANFDEEEYYQQAKEKLANPDWCFPEIRALKRGKIVKGKENGQNAPP